MSNNRKKKFGSTTDLTIDSLVSLATVVNLFIQYPHTKLVIQSCGQWRSQDFVLEGALIFSSVTAELRERGAELLDL